MAQLSKIAGSLTEKEFLEAVAKFPRLSEKARNVAFDVLVHGHTFVQVEEMHDTSRQLAHNWASKIFEAFCPQGWVSEIVTLPPAQMKQVRKMEQDARKAWQADQPQARIVRKR